MTSMNFEWTLESEEEQHSVGLVLRYSSQTCGVPALAFIHTYPQLPKSDYARIAHVTVLLESKRSQITKGTFKGIYHDILEIIRARETELFPKKSKPLEYVQTHTLLCDRLPKLEHFSAGDFAFDDLDYAKSAY